MSLKQKIEDAIHAATDEGTWAYGACADDIVEKMTANILDVIGQLEPAPKHHQSSQGAM